MANALRISGEADVLAVDPQSGTYPVTMLGWARIVNDRNTYSAILTLEAGPGHSVEWNELCTDADGTTLVMCDHASLWATVGTMVVGTWHKIAMVITSGHVEAYFGTEGTAGVVQTVDATIANVSAVDYQGVGASNFAYAEWFDGRLSGVRVWNAALTEAEIEAEFRSATPVRTAGLLGAWLPPDVEVATVLDAIAGADLVDGVGGGTPHYTIEDGPTLDPEPVVEVVSLRSPWPSGNVVYLTDTLLSSTAVGWEGCASVVSGIAACSTAATGEQSSEAAPSGTAAASCPVVGASWASGAAGGTALASASCSGSWGDLVAASGTAAASGSAVGWEGGSGCVATPETIVVSGSIVDWLWSASCVSGTAEAHGPAVGEQGSVGAVSSAAPTVAVRRIVGRLVPVTARAAAGSTAMARVAWRMVPPTARAVAGVA